MCQSTVTINKIGRDIHGRRSQRIMRLLLAQAITLIILVSFVLVDSSWAAVIQEDPTWHDFSPQDEVTNPPVVATVELTTDSQPVQATGVYSISFDAGTTWVGPISVQSVTDLGSDEWRFETRRIPFPNGVDNRVRFAVELEDEQRIQSPAYQVSVNRKRFLPVVLRDFPAAWARYESNDTTASAYGPLESYRVYEAYIWPAGDQDYYFIDVAPTAADITVSLTNIAANADYDLYLYDSTSTLVANSAQYGNVDEFIRYRSPAPGRYFIRIYPYQGASQVQPYRLRADFP